MTLVVHGATVIDADGIREDAWVHARDGMIDSVGLGGGWTAYGAEHVIDAGGLTVTPGFIDLHCHGGGGHRFESPDEQVEAALGVHRRMGTTRSVLSLASASIDELCGALDRLASVAAADPLVLGTHLEGPFLSPHRAGAHDLGVLRTPTATDVGRLIESARGCLRQLTIAPELAGALDAIAQLTAAGVAVAVGHTAATYDQARAGFDAGASILTHAFNAMPGIGHREPGPVAAAFDARGITLELINDGRHVDPSVVRMTFRQAPDRVALITDAMAATGLGDGHYQLGSRDVDVVDGVATLADDGTLAGSTITLLDAVRRAIDDGIDPVVAVSAATATPAAALGLEGRLGRIAAGYAADLVVLDASWQPVHVFADGSEVAR